MKNKKGVMVERKINSMSIEISNEPVSSLNLGEN